ncbi:hypothetical protein N9272_01340 [bacterium]|nr:hypothetical protein [bacterium]MDB4539133.1 hypothetical protein [Saprospiraceae bacterium]
MQRLLIFMIVFITGCHQSSDVLYEAKDFKLQGKGVLLTTRFNSFEEFKKEVQVEYSKDEKSWVRLTQNSNNQIVSSILKSGVKESDIVAIRDGGLIGKIKLVLTAPYFVTNRNDILRVYMLTRRRHRIFGGGDIAFFDIAKTMMRNINSADLRNIPEEDLSEKGYINTFNHANSQALMTAIFSEQLADFIADTHERSNMPELITGKFTDVQIADIKNGPVDNYVDIINNEWGQELGKLLGKKYQISRETVWTPELLVNFFNDLQSYYSWVFQIGFEPFKSSDDLMIRFSKKINKVMKSTEGLR